MTLEVDVHIPRADIRATFEVADDDTVAILGPNGAGKSSILGAITGTVAATGQVLLHGQNLLGLPPHRRRVGLLGQRALLFPHLSVLDNVAFGPRSAGRPRRRARALAGDWLERLEASHWADRRPDQLSGGQQQRVAMARALAAEPDVMLLDEPFAAIDAEAIDGLRTLVRRHVNTTCIIVTHDLPDALTLADRVIVLDEGRIVEEGRTTEVLTRPRSRFAARIAGVNLVTGTLADMTLTCAGTVITGRPVEDDPDSHGVAVFPPRAVAVYPTRPHGSPRNTWPVEVRTVRSDGPGVFVTANHPDLGEVTAEVTSSAAAELDLQVGTHLWFAVKAQEVDLLPRARQHRAQRRPRPSAI